jgi:hypothetical protein
MLNILSKMFSDDRDKFWRKEKGIPSGPVLLLLLFFNEVLSSMIEMGEFIGSSGLSASNLIGELASIVVFRVTKSLL